MTDDVVSPHPVPPHTIVVGVDATKSAQDAVVWAARESERRGSVLVMVLAVEEHLDGAAVPDGADSSGPLGEARALLGQLSDLAHEVAPDIEVRPDLIEGWPVPALEKASRRADLLVVGSHGASRLSVALLGSTAVQLAAGGTAPLVVVRGPDPEDFPESGNLPVVVGLDDSAAALRAADFAAVEAAYAHSPVVVVHVAQDPARDKASAEAFERVVAANPGLDIRYRHVSGHVAAALVDCSAGARLLVTGSRAHGGMALLRGSVSQTLIRKSPCPLAVIPPTMPIGESPSTVSTDPPA